VNGAVETESPESEGRKSLPGKKITPGSRHRDWKRPDAGSCSRNGHYLRMKLGRTPIAEHRAEDGSRPSPGLSSTIGAPLIAWAPAQIFRCLLHLHRGAKRDIG